MASRDRLRRRARLPRCSSLMVAGVLLSGCAADPPVERSRGDVESTAIGPMQAATVTPCSHPEPVAIRWRPNPGPGDRSAALPGQPSRLWQRLRAGFGFPESTIHHGPTAQAIRHFETHSYAFEHTLTGARPLLEWVLHRIEAAGLPTELALLPLIESAYDPRARSSRGAAGLWQLMPTTGEALGLPVDRWYDARYDVAASTAAAIRHLRWLHERFPDDWLLTVAAYNAGNGRVQRAPTETPPRAVPSSASSRFWTLDLPAETERYVLRLLALKAILADPARYGIELPQTESDNPLVIINLGRRLAIPRVAEVLGTPTEQILRFNPAFRRGVTPPDGPHELLVTEAQAKALRALPAPRLAELAPRPSRIEVQPGDTLSQLARRLETTVDALRHANALVDVHHIRVGQILTLPRAQPDGLTATP